MNAAFRRWLPCATLATWSAILLGFWASGRMRSLLTPEFRLGAVAAGIVMGLMALAFLFFPADAACCSAAECGHTFFKRSAGKIITFLILLLPITAAAMFNTDSYSANLIKNSITITDASQLGGAPRNVSLKPVDMPLPTKDPNNAPATARHGCQTTPAAPPSRRPRPKRSHRSPRPRRIISSGRPTAISSPKSSTCSTPPRTTPCARISKASPSNSSASSCPTRRTTPAASASRPCACS